MGVLRNCLLGALPYTKGGGKASAIATLVCVFFPVFFPYMYQKYFRHNLRQLFN